MNETVPKLFEPLQLRGRTLPNRVVVSPMCQYSGIDGCAGDWHLVHYGGLALGGNGMLIFEMTNVTPEGRISPGCLGLYDDACETALKRVVDFCRTHTDAPLALQIAHAGRKASTRAPWEDRAPLTAGEGGWQPVAPSDLPSGPGAPQPRQLEEDDIQSLVQAFAGATERAARIGFDAVEVHAAHGYLLHQFLSPLSNRREDAYGGDLANRMRFPLAVFDAMRAAWPADRPMGVRLSATDWVAGGWDLEQSAVFARELERRGCDWLDVSSGGLSPAQVIPSTPGYQVPFAARLREETSMKIMTVGMITEPRQAEDILAADQADLVALARGMLYDPRWTWHAARELGGVAVFPRQYLRARPSVRGDVFADRGSGKT